jgi:nitroimidazol reductase NimA-like FMN-containing flavoprotein (pyridoxamine 5'-phosphate oxidase superfamily)
MTTTTVTPEADQFLREHRLCVLGTGRKDGSPQLSTVMYDFNGSDFVVSVRRKSAKWVNAGRKHQVALIVLEGRRQLVCYGSGERLAGGTERLAASRRLRARGGQDGPEPTDAELDATLEADDRGILRITPDSVTLGG